ncbi:hypothetical protein SAMN05443377_103131 [Propionibacterium cyclohexanicum]|uniref:Uncharacterized protein n=1 Tax=Propionibacterium cyclohexanicum TaxID=64702 RepID=A0A1H9QI05_9ACTN|nr:hypothetical protein [Propionibacterium cyclohexanicum]SER60191.1 hypothetical protein SAMN05443377_103131 [Propionibacterium cyclohexanicum]
MKVHRRSAPRPAEIGSALVWGLLFIAIAVMALLVATGELNTSSLRYLLPATLIVAGALGLLVSRPRR